MRKDREPSVAKVNPRIKRLYKHDGIKKLFYYFCRLVLTDNIIGKKLAFYQLTRSEKD